MTFCGTAEDRNRRIDSGTSSNCSTTTTTIYSTESTTTYDRDVWNVFQVVVVGQRNRSLFSCSFVHGRSKQIKRRLLSKVVCGLSESGHMSA
ncbi:hypothetical protein Mapa_014626 [Marchantia paleacea]|nr:hypothetical protein Mapa_014626 [Marchantia paleacea]